MFRTHPPLGAAFFFETGVIVVLNFNDFILLLKMDN